MSKPVVNLVNEREEIITSLDNVVMPVVLETIENGRTLDVSDYTGTHIKGGHVIIKKTDEALYKPMPLNANKDGYGTLPSGYQYAGFQYGTVTKERPFGAIMIRGTVVTEASPYPLTTILSAVRTALPLVHFKTDKD